MFDKFKKAAGAMVETAEKAVKAVKNALVDPDVREEGLSGAEIHRIFSEGSSRSLRTAADEWEKSGEKYEEAREALAAALRAAWPDWEGAAATAAKAAMAPLEQSLAAARDAATRASTAIGTQADWFDRTQNSVHALADNPPADPGPAVAAMFADLEKKADEYHEKSDANRQFYREYVDATRQNLSALPEFTPPPPLGQDVPVSAATPGGGGVLSGAPGSSGSWQGLTNSQANTPTQPGSAATDVVRPADTGDRSGANTVAARSDSPVRGSAVGRGGEQSRSGNREHGRSGNGEHGRSGNAEPGARFGCGHRAEPVRGRETRGSIGRPTTAQPMPGAPGPFGQQGKRDDEERTRRSHLPGPDRWTLFGLDEEPVPAVIGLWKEKS